MDNQIFSNNQQESKVYKNPKIGSITFFGAFVFFFFCFFLVQCGGSSRYSNNDKDGMKITGVALATGGINNAVNKVLKSNGTLDGYTEAPASIWAFIALLCTLVGIPAAILYNKKAAFLSYWAGIVGAVSLIILPIHLYFNWHDKIDMSLVHFKFGYFAALGCLIAAAYFCYKRYNEIFNVKNNGN